MQLPTDDYNRARLVFADVAGWRHQMATLDLTAYAELLFSLGARDLTVFEKVYPHVLPDADAVLEWARGTTLLPYLERLPPAQRRPISTKCGVGCTSSTPMCRYSFPSGASSFTRRRA